jgi:hypothetical protein
MKTKLLVKIPVLSFLVLAVMSLSSCLKDSRYVDLSASPPIAEFPIVPFSGQFQPAAYPIQTTPQALQVVVDIASASPLSTSTTFNIIIDQAALTAYNTANSTNYLLLPAADYTVSSLNVVVPAGQRQATLTFMINSSLIDLTKQFILPLTIQSASGLTLSANYATVFYNVQAKNIYDGDWTVTGTMNDLGAANVGRYPIDYYLETQNATDDGMYDFAGAGTFAHEITSAAGTQSYYGSFAPIFTFSGSGASTTITKVVNYYGQPASNGRYAQLDPSGQNKFIKGSPGVVGSQFQVSYFMYQPSVIASGPRVSFNETWTYNGPRP